MLLGTIEEWTQVDKFCWTHPDYPGVVTLSEGVSFADYWQKRLSDDAPERRKVDRRIIIERLAKAGLLDYAEAALLAAPAVVRWRWNTTDAVYADDPDTLTFLKAIGADPEAILAP